MCIGLSNAYLMEEEHGFAIDLGIDILSQMGCRLPKRTGGIMFKTIMGFLSTKRPVKKLIPEVIGRLPVKTDPVHVGIMKMLDAFMFPCYYIMPESLSSYK